MISWVARAKCGHDTGGSCAERHVPVVGQPAWCVTCKDSTYLVDVVDTRPLRDKRGLA